MALRYLLGLPRRLDELAWRLDAVEAKLRAKATTADYAHGAREEEAERRFRAELVEAIGPHRIGAYHADDAAIIAAVRALAAIADALGGAGVELPRERTSGPHETTVRYPPPKEKP